MGRQSLFALMALLIAPVAARGGEFFFVPVPITAAAVADDPTLASMQTVSLRVTFLDNEYWESACMHAVLPPGNFFYKHALNTVNTRPNPAFVALFPALEFTTYVSGPRDTGAPGGTPPTILGPCPPGTMLSSLAHLWKRQARDLVGAWNRRKRNDPGQSSRRRAIASSTR